MVFLHSSAKAMASCRDSVYVYADSENRFFSLWSVSPFVIDTHTTGRLGTVWNKVKLPAITVSAQNHENLCKNLVFQIVIGIYDAKQLMVVFYEPAK